MFECREWIEYLNASSWDCYETVELDHGSGTKENSRPRNSIEQGLNSSGTIVQLRGFMEGKKNVSSQWNHRRAIS